MSVPYIPPTAEQRQAILKQACESERLVKEAERKKITTLSRSKTWELERKGQHPMRRKLGSNSVAWLLSDLLWFIHEPLFTGHHAGPTTIKRA